jgi:hypothetical protein
VAKSGPYDQETIRSRQILDSFTDKPASKDKRMNGEDETSDLLSLFSGRSTESAKDEDADDEGGWYTTFKTCACSSESERSSTGADDER